MRRFERTRIGRRDDASIRHVVSYHHKRTLHRRSARTSAGADVVKRRHRPGDVVHGRSRRKRHALLRRGIADARSTDDLFDLQRQYAPIDESAVDAEELGYELRAAACHLSGGPPPPRDRFTLTRAVPADARATFTVRGRIGERIAAVVWADGALYGSLYALARLEARPAADDGAACALARIVAAFDEVYEAPAADTFEAAVRRVA
jgi:hypothetical protein